MKTTYDYMTMLFIGSTGKTTKWSVTNNRTHICIGKIKWHSRWRSYAFFPMSKTMFDSNCLIDLIDFMEQLNMQRKYNKD